MNLFQLLIFLRTPKIELSNPVFKDKNGITISFLEFLKFKGINTIRIGYGSILISEHSSLSEVKSFSETLKSMGFKIYLSLHYSDSWADPGHQITPCSGRMSHMIH